MLANHSFAGARKGDNPKDAGLERSPAETAWLSKLSDKNQLLMLDR